MQNLAQSSSEAFYSQPGQSAPKLAQGKDSVILTKGNNLLVQVAMQRTIDAQQEYIQALESRQAHVDRFLANLDDSMAAG